MVHRLSSPAPCGLYEAIERLPDSHRQYFEARWLDDMSWAEMSMKFGIKEKDLRRLVDEGKKLLEDLLP